MPSLTHYGSLAFQPSEAGLAELTRVLAVNPGTYLLVPEADATTGLERESVMPDTSEDEMAQIRADAAKKEEALRKLLHLKNPRLRGGTPVPPAEEFKHLLPPLHTPALGAMSGNAAFARVDYRQATVVCPVPDQTGYNYFRNQACVAEILPNTEDSVYFRTGMGVEGVICTCSDCQRRWKSAEKLLQEEATPRLAVPLRQCLESSGFALTNMLDSEAGRNGRMPDYQRVNIGHLVKVTTPYRQRYFEDWCRQYGSSEVKDLTVEVHNLWLEDKVRQEARDQGPTQAPMSVVSDVFQELRMAVPNPIRTRPRRPAAAAEYTYGYRPRGRP